MAFGESLLEAREATRRDDPSEVALAATAALGRAGLEAALYGGLALAVYGEPRETRDAHFAVAAVSAEAAHAALAASNIDGVIAFSAVRGSRLAR